MKRVNNIVYMHQKDLQIRVFEYFFSSKTYVVGTQKNPLNETVFLSTKKRLLKLMGKKVLTVSFLKALLI